MPSTTRQQINGKIKINLAKYQQPANLIFLSTFAIFVSHCAHIGGDAFNGYEKMGNSMSIGMESFQKHPNLRLQQTKHWELYFP